MLLKGWEFNFNNKYCQLDLLIYNNNDLSNLIWKKEGEEGLCIEYPNIALHAVSRDLAAFPHECIYVMLDKNILSMQD